MKRSRLSLPSTDPSQDVNSNQPDGPYERVDDEERETSGDLCSLFTLPPSRETPLTAEHVQAAFARAQRVGTPLLSGGPRRQLGGLSRTRLFVI